MNDIRSSVYAQKVELLLRLIPIVMEDSEFTNDMQSLLRPGITFNASDAYPLIYETFIDRMEGKRD